MKRLKTFLIYAIIIVALYFLVDILRYLAINSTYKNKESRIYTNEPEIIISQNKATYINGVIKGTIKNNTNELIDNKYLKIDLYSSNNVMLGTKYVKIEKLSTGTSSNFEMWYRFTGVNYATFSVVENVDNIQEEELISEQTAQLMIIGTLFSLYFI